MFGIKKYLYLNPNYNQSFYVTHIWLYKHDRNSFIKLLLSLIFNSSKLFIIVSLIKSIENKLFNCATEKVAKVNNSMFVFFCYNVCYLIHKISYLR